MLCDAVATFGCQVVVRFGCHCCRHNIVPRLLLMALRAYLIQCGWTAGVELLEVVVDQLTREEITDARALVGCDLDDVVGADSWPPEVRQFLLQLTLVAVFAVCCACAA